LAKDFGVELIRSGARRSEARNIGLKHARSDGVLFLDSDMIAPPSLIQECENGLVKHEALFIPEESIGTGFWAKCKAVERRLYVGDAIMEAARCFRRNTLVGLGGYNPELEAGEDWDLQNRVEVHHLNLGRVSPTILHDEGQLSLSSITRKKYSYGKSFAKYVHDNMTVSIGQINPLRRIIVPGLRILPYSPKLAAGFTIMKSIELTSAGLGHLIGNSKQEFS